MFTEEEKIRAIELYFKYGKKLAPVVRELGYPSKRNLRRWIRSWEAGGGAKESIRHKHRYSDEQKQVAVEHYLNHGCCLAFTSRALGYPCTDVLARWVNERYPDRRRIFTSKVNPVAPFEPEVKRQAVMALCTRQVSASEIARRIGVSRAVLYKWKDEIIGNSAYQTMRKHNEPSLEAERDALREEVARLNQEIRHRQMELDILKKAEEIIKKDPGISISHLNNREKTKIADALRQTYPLTELLHVLGLARSSYFYHRAAPKAGDKYATIRTMLTDIFNSNYIDMRLAENVWNSEVIFAEIKAMGYTGGRSMLRYYIQPNRKMRPSKRTVRFETQPGYQLQHDWGEVEVEVAGQRCKVNFAVNTLGFSRRFHVFAAPKQDAEHTYESLVRAFRYFGGCVKTVLVDNQKAAVLKNNNGKVVFNSGFLLLADHYNFLPRACRPRRARTKGKVERMVKYLKENFFVRYRRFDSFTHVNQQLEQWIADVADKRELRQFKETPEQRFALEQEHLQPLPDTDFDTSYFDTRPGRQNNTAVVRIRAADKGTTTSGTVP